MAGIESGDRQKAFARAAAQSLRQSRRRQGLTQSQLADATGGLVSKAALANYETGLRSLRIDIFWVLANALGEDAGGLLAAAERASGLGGRALIEPITVDIDAVSGSADPRLDPVRRWFAMRRKRATTRQEQRTMTLDSAALTALSQLMGVTAEQCRALLAATGAGAAAAPGPAVVSGSAVASGPAARAGVAGPGLSAGSAATGPAADSGSAAHAGTLRPGSSATTAPPAQSAVG